MASQRAKTIRDWPVIEALEPRLMLSAGWNVALIDGALPEAEQLVCAAVNADLIHVYDGSNETAGEVLSHVSALASAAEMKIDSVSILSHGRAGGFALGNEYVSTEALADQASAWSELASSLAPGANIYIFGCEVGGPWGEGQDLLDQLANLTGADVFASDDTTGSGGDWVLEAASGGDEAELAAGLSTPFDMAMLSEYQFSLDPPIIDDQSLPNVNEDATNGTVVGTVSATDPDEDPLTYSITAGNDDGVFAINSSTGEITVTDNTNLDYETTTSYSLTVLVEDTGSLTDTATITVNVTDVNDNTPVITASQSFDVAENAADSTSVGTALATDADTTGPLQRWRITAGNGDGIFAINGSTGEITVTDNTNLDRETTDTYVLTLAVGDGVYTSAAETVTINVTDVNDNTPVITASQSFDVAENAADSTSVGTALATDADTTSTLESWRITAGNGDGIFAINGSTGEITVTDNTNLDRETTDTYVLTLAVGDGAYTSAAETVTINVTDVNEAPSVSNDTLGLAENASNGTVVGTASASDVDAGDSLTYSITAGNDDGVFAINSSTGEITVTDNSTLDYETTTSYSLTVRVEDTGSLTDDATVTININDINEASVTTLSTERVRAWFSYQSQMAATASSTPSRTAAAKTYSSTGGDDAFATDSSPGEMTANDQTAGDGETDPSWELTGQVEDSGQSTGDAADTMGLNDLNEQTAINDQSLANVSASAARPGGPVKPTRTKNRGSQKAAVGKPARPLEQILAESPTVIELARGPNQIMAESPALDRLSQGLDQIMAESSAVDRLSQGLDQIMAESSAVVESIRTNLPMRGQLESMKRKMARATGSEDRKEKIIVGTTTVATISFAAGYVIWMCRGGSVLASVRSPMPLWKWFDPLPALGSGGKHNLKRKSGKNKHSANDSDDEDVEALFESEGRT